MLSGVGGHLECEDVFGIESRIDAAEFPKTLKEQSRADEEHEGRRSLHDHECVASQMARPGPNPKRVPQTAHDLEIRKPHGRQETGRKCGKSGDARGEEQCGCVDSDGTQPWDAFRSCSDNQRHTHPRKQNATRASERRQ